MPYDIVNYKHDIESFTSDLAKLAAIRDSEKGNNELLIARLQAINSIARGLAAKTAFLRYTDVSQSNSDIAVEVRRHALAKTVERVCYAARQLNRLHHGRVISRPFNLERASYGEFKGPDFFEFIPFALIDNAVKYKLRDGTVDVLIHESGTFGLVDISSLGPVILNEEREAIFLEGQRGHFARKTGRGGSGIGLYHARHAMRTSFGGDVELLRSDDTHRFDVDGVPYDNHTFRIRVPLVN